MHTAPTVVQSRNEAAVIYWLDPVEWRRARVARHTPHAKVVWEGSIAGGAYKAA